MIENKQTIHFLKTTLAIRTQVLISGLHDRCSSLNKLREPNDVRPLVMRKIWNYVIADWQDFMQVTLLVDF